MKKRFGLFLLSALVAVCAFSACEGIGVPSGSGGGQGSGLHTHVDADSNGLCDVCKVKTLATFDFYSINDLHGKIDDTYANIGVDEMTAYLQAAQAQNENTILLSAGDMWQGSAESNFTKGKLVTEWMNELDFAAMAMGNHEFDWGESYLESNETLAEFPFLGINVYDVDTNERVSYCKPSVTVEKSGVKIGIIGAIGDCYSSIAEEQVRGVYFKTDDELTALVKAEAQKLRLSGADFIVYMLHDAEVSNRSHYDEELSDGYVDLVFEGHSHTIVQEQDWYGVWHLQAGGDNATGLSHARVEINLLNGEASVKTAQIVDHTAYEALADAPIVDELLEKYEDELEQVNEVLGQNDEYRDTEDLRECAAEALYLFGEERWGSEAKYQGKIVLGGGYVNVRSPGYLPMGKVTYGYIYPLFPFDNPVVLCSVSGQRLERQFIQSANYCCYYGEYGEWVKENLDYNATYYVIVDTYCANYNFQGLGNMNIVEYYDEERTVFSRDALAEFIRSGGMGVTVESEYSTIPEILAIGSALADNEETSVKYRIQAEVLTVHNKTYGNLTVVDKNGNTLYIYGTYDENGTRYDGMAKKPAVGDELVLEGKIKRYVDRYGAVTVELVDAVVTFANGGGGGTGTETLKTLNVSLGGSLSQYSTGNYGDCTVNGFELEFYRAYTPKNADYLTRLLPYVSSENDGTAAGSLYNVSPIYGIQSIKITYRSESGAFLYTGDDRVAAMTAYSLAKTTSYQTVTLSVDTDNFFKIDSGNSELYVQELTVFYTGKTVSYNAVKKPSGEGDKRLNATTYSGTLVAGQSAVAVPVKVEYDGGSCLIKQTKTYTYYTLEYVELNPSFIAAAAMTAPADIAAYYAAFKQFPANFAAKNFDGNSFWEVEQVFGDDTRYVSKYSRTNGYAQHVPFNEGNTVYYEFDVALVSSYWTNGERGVGRVVSWEGGWDSVEYDSSPVSVYTDDHYATFQEYLNDGTFGERFDAEGNLTFTKWTAPDTVATTK